MNTKTLYALRLANDSYPVPSESHGHEVGLALTLALCSARLRRRGWQLARDYGGQFHLRLLREPNVVTEIYSGFLPELLKPRALGFGATNLNREAGIPEGTAEITIAGTLLLRLFVAAERTRVTVAFDFRPWVSPGLRYRLIFYAATPGPYGRSELPLLRAATVEKILLAGLAFLASEPKVG
jgi:hypothetical protein